MKIYITGIAFVAILACGITPGQIASETKAACTIVQAFVQNEVVYDVCATAPEITAIVADIASMRATADAGAAKLEKCRIIPTTTLCATSQETLGALRNLKRL